MPPTVKRKIEDWRPHALEQLGVTEDLWLEFIRHRALLKKPMTDHAQYLACRRLWLLRKQGNDPVSVVEQSIERGWLGLFGVQEEVSRAAGKGGKSRTRSALEELEDIANGR